MRQHKRERRDIDAFHWTLHVILALILLGVFAARCQPLTYPPDGKCRVLCEQNFSECLEECAHEPAK